MQQQHQLSTQIERNGINHERYILMTQLWHQGRRSCDLDLYSRNNVLELVATGDISASQTHFV